MKVLDVGSGVGGPACEIAELTDASIVGINNNDYQIERARHHAVKRGLSEQLEFVKGDFMVSDAIITQGPREASNVRGTIANAIRRQQFRSCL